MTAQLWLDTGAEETIDLGVDSLRLYQVFAELDKTGGMEDYPELFGVIDASEEQDDVDPGWLSDVRGQARDCLARHGEDVGEAARGVLRALAGEDVQEGCVPNKVGRGHHDDKTGHKCSPTGKERHVNARAQHKTASAAHKSAGRVARSAATALDKARQFHDKAHDKAKELKAALRSKSKLTPAKQRQLAARLEKAQAVMQKALDKVKELGKAHRSATSAHKKTEKGVGAAAQKVELAKAKAEQAARKGKKKPATKRPTSVGPQPPEPGFTGRDSLGREWADGKLVAKRDKAPSEPNFLRVLKDVGSTLKDRMGKDIEPEEYLAHKVRVADLYDAAKDKLGGMSLDDFKAELLRLNNEGKLRLSRADLTAADVQDQHRLSKDQVHDFHQRDMRSEINHPGGGTFHTLNVKDVKAGAPAQAPAPAQTRAGYAEHLAALKDLHAAAARGTMGERGQAGVDVAAVDRAVEAAGRDLSAPEAAKLARDFGIASKPKNKAEALKMVRSKIRLRAGASDRAHEPDVHANMGLGGLDLYGTDPGRAVPDLVAAFAKLNKKGGNLVSLADLKDATEMSKERLHATVQQLRKDGVLTGSRPEGRHGITPREREAMLRDGDDQILYVSVKDPEKFQALLGGK